MAAPKKDGILEFDSNSTQEEDAIFLELSNYVN
jgi:hypothetical protein